MILYFFIIFATPVYADSFDVSKDTSTSNYYQAVSLSTEGYPEIWGIEYAKSDFLADDTSGVLSTGISEYTDLDFTRRIPNTADRVYGPPGTIVDLIYLYKNNAGHEVSISKIDVALSRTNRELGNLTDVLNISDTNTKDILYKYSNQNLMRSGIYKEYDGLGNIPNGVDGAYVLESLTIKNPLVIEEASYTKNADGMLDVSIYIRNTSNEYLNNLVFSYLPHEEIFNLRAGDEKVINFSLNEEPEELKPFSIYNPNIREICSIDGSPYYTYTAADAVPVFAYRTDSFVAGAVVQPARESMCIKRTAYTMYKDEWFEKDATQETAGAVLGVSDESKNMVLPKTGKKIWWVCGLLVVDAVLWYSWYIYESKNANSRLRTKSSKNAQQGGL